jgi:hexosaminidase
MQQSMVISTGQKVKFSRRFEVLKVSSLNPAKALPWLRWIGWVILAPPVAFPALAPAQVHLLPAPREAHFQGETALPARIAVTVPGHDTEDQFAARDLEEAVKQSALTGTGNEKAAYRVVLLRSGSAEAKAQLARRGLSFDQAMEGEGYVLVVEPRQALVIGASGSGIFYGVQTFKQLLPPQGANAVLATGTVRDWPAMKYRGIDDDLSRGPFPTLEFQKHQIRVFASFKINIYSPYFEHTLLYSNHSLAAPPGSSLTSAEVKELVAYAGEYHVTVVPEQEAFGHLHHVLKNEIYEDVAETPHGHVLAPGQPGTLPLIKDWFTQIAEEFPSPFIHMGADETWDLGQGRTKPEVQAQGYGPVYVDFLKQIHDELAPLNRRLLFWGDIGVDDPSAVAKLPKDMIAVPWNYRKTEGFENMIEPFVKAGIETWVAPGDANWKEVYPVAKTAFGNIQGFIRDGQRLGSTGALTTVWNDDGEGLFNMNWYSLLFGAVAAWQPGESSIQSYQDFYGPVFHGDLSGKINQAEKELMAAHEALGNAHTGMDSNSVFWIDPWSAEGQQISAEILPITEQLRTHAEQAIVLVEEARAANPHLREAEALTAMDLGARRLDLIGLKFELAEEIAKAYREALTSQQDKSKARQMRTMLGEISGSNGRCQDIRDAYSALKDEYSQVWLSENRPYWLNNVTVRYDLRVEAWQQRAERFSAVNRAFAKGRELPSPSELGLPAGSE